MRQMTTCSPVLRIHVSTPSSFLFRRCSRYRNASLKQTRTTPSRWTEAVRVADSNPSLPPLVVLECDGILVDLHTDGHRPAFNLAFREMGLECANWSPEVYHDLIRTGDGTEDGLVKLFFDKIGWPQTLATTDYKAFVENVLKIKKIKLKESIGQQGVDLRRGVIQFLDEVLESEATVAVLTETQSDTADGVWKGVKCILGDERSATLRRVAWPKNSEREEEAEEILEERIREMKRDEARAFVETMNARRREKQAGIKIDPNLMQTSTSRATPPIAMLEKRRIFAAGIDPVFFLTMATSLGSSVLKCALVSAHHSILQSAAASGVLSIAVPAGLASRLDFKSTATRFDGFGAGGGLTWSRLNSLLNQRCPP